MNRINNIIDFKSIIEKLKNNKIVISVSGGLDSMVLLDGLSSVQPIVVHFNHNSRSDNSQDEKLVKDFCFKKNLRLIIINLNFSQSGFQEKSHKLRKKHLTDIAKKNFAKYILTAHHKDDLIESTLMKIIKGSPFENFPGLIETNSYSDLIFFKPLIHYSKEDLIKYAKEKSTPFRDDKSNNDNKYFRNRVRNTLIPLLKKENPSFGSSLIDLGNYLSMSSDYFKDFVKNINISKSRNKFKSYNLTTQFFYLKYLANKNNIYLSKKKIDLAIELINSKKSNAELHVGESKKLIVAYDKFEFQNIGDTNLPNELPSEVTLGDNIFSKYNISIFFDNAEKNKKGYSKICYNKKALKFILRTRKNGDKLNFVYGTKKLNKHLVDIKYPKHLRDSLLILTDLQNKILWVEGIYINKTFKGNYVLWLRKIDKNA